MFTLLRKGICPLIRKGQTVCQCRTEVEVEGFPSEKQSKPLTAEMGEQLQTTQLTAKLKFMQGLKCNYTLS